MTKLFCFSDCHGFADELKQALDESGFDPNNKEHYLIGLGDYIDRGRQPQKVIDYLMSLERKVLIKGNHTSLLLDCIQRGYPYNYDWSNGTAQTIIDLAPEAQTFNEACEIAYSRVKDFVYSMVDYCETENYIFTHSFIPLNSDDASFDPNWRSAPYDTWENARWGNPFLIADQGLLPDKTLVFGHFHTSWARSYFDGQPEWGDQADFSIYYGDGYIGLDACAAYSGKVNVLVLEDNFL